MGLSNGNSNFGFGGGVAGGGGGGISFVTTCNTATFSLYGNGTPASPLYGTPILSSCPNQGIVACSDGLFANSAVIVLGTGTGSSVRCGFNNTASGNFSSVMGGCNNFATGSFSFSGNGLSNTTASIYGTSLSGKLNTVNSFSVAGSILSGFGNIVNACEFGIQKVSAPSFIGSGVMNYIGSSTAYSGFCVAGSGTCLVIGSNVTANFSAGNDVLYYNCLDSRPFKATICSSTLSSGCTILETTGFFGTDGLSCGYVRNLTTGVNGGNGNAILSGVANTITAGESNLILGGVCNRNTGQRSLLGNGAGNVASGSGSVLMSGLSNTSSGYNSFLGNGNSVTASGSFAFVGNGNSITASGNFSFVGTGQDNTVSSGFGSIVTGRSNSVCTTSIGGFIGGGSGNTIAACCNAGNSFANPSSLITGGAMNQIGDTKIYSVYCKNGNCLYLVGDQTADFSTTRNIKYYNNCDKLAYGTVICSATYSAPYTEVVSLSPLSGSNGIINGYLRNLDQATSGSVSGGFASVISGGYLNTASGAYTSILGGFYNTVLSTANGANITGGYCNTASASYSAVMGGKDACSYRYGQRTWSSGQFSAQGDSQQVELVARNKTTNDTSVLLYLDGSATGISVPSGKAMLVTILTFGIRSDGGQVASSYDYVVIKNVGGITSIVHQSNIKQHYDIGSYSITIQANNTTDELEILVNGDAGETLRWTAYITGVEVAYGV